MGLHTCAGMFHLCGVGRTQNSWNCCRSGGHSPRYRQSPRAPTRRTHRTSEPRNRRRLRAGYPRRGLIILQKWKQTGHRRDPLLSDEPPHIVGQTSTTTVSRSRSPSSLAGLDPRAGRCRSAREYEAHAAEHLDDADRSVHLSTCASCDMDSHARQPRPVVGDLPAGAAFSSHGLGLPFLGMRAARAPVRVVALRSMPSAPLWRLADGPWAELNVQWVVGCDGLVNFSGRVC